MNRRRFMLGVGLLLTIWGVAEFAWRMSTPATKDLMPLPMANERLGVAYSYLLDRPGRSREYDYTPALQAEYRAKLPTWYRFQRAHEEAMMALANLGFPRDLVLDLERRTKRGVLDEARKAVGPLPRLTPEAERRLRPLAVRWQGVWLMSDPVVADQVGLTEDQRRAFADASLNVYARYSLETERMLRDSARLGGASGEALRANDSLVEIEGDGWAFRSWALTDAERAFRDARWERLRRSRAHRAEGFLGGWIDDHLEDLRSRRVWDFRKGEEARLLATLTPVQRARWDAFCEG